MTDFIREPCMDCFRKDAEVERLRTDYSILKRDYDALRQELADCKHDWLEILGTEWSPAALEPKP